MLRCSWSSGASATYSCDASAASASAIAGSSTFFADADWRSASLLEQLPQVVLTVEDTVEGSVRGGPQEAAAASAYEARLVVELNLQGHLWEVFAEGAFGLEQLFKMGLAVKNPIHGGMASHRKCAFAVAVSEF